MAVEPTVRHVTARLSSVAAEAVARNAKKACTRLGIMDQQGTKVAAGTHQVAARKPHLYSWLWHGCFASLGRKDSAVQV